MRGWDLFEREVEENDDIDVWSTGGGYTNRFGEDLLMYGMRMSPGGKRVNPGVVYVFTFLLSRKKVTHIDIQIRGLHSGGRFRTTHD